MAIKNSTRRVTMTNKTVHDARVAFLRIGHRAAEAKVVAKAARSLAQEDVLTEDDQVALFRVVQHCAEAIEQDLGAFEVLSLALRNGEDVAPALEAANG